MSPVWVHRYYIKSESVLHKGKPLEAYDNELIQLQESNDGYGIDYLLDLNY